MDNKDPKKWWKSKTIWTGVLTVAYGVVNGLGIPLPPGIVETLIGLGLICGRASNRPIK